MTSAAGLTLSNVPAGGGVILTVKIKAGNGASIGSSKAVNVIAASKTLGSRFDVVTAKARVIR